MAVKDSVLIIDDSKANIQFLYALIRDDYDVLFATSGREGIRIARDRKPDLILLDIVMPDMNGYDVIQHLKGDKELSRIPVIFISALDDTEDEKKGFDCGAVDYIIKPFRPEIAKARIKTHLLLKKQRDLLNALAICDQLTNIYNRRYFFEHIEQEWFRCCRSQQDLSLLLIDVDYFKPYNDHYGHQMGDECLAQIGQTLKNALKRPMDIAARYGGEEFVILLPETNHKGAYHLAQQLHQAIWALNIPHADSTVAPRVTVSIGVATRIPDQKQEFHQLIKEADENLYKAKAEGRNLIVCSTSF